MFVLMVVCVKLLELFEMNIVIGWLSGLEVRVNFLSILWVGLLILISIMFGVWVVILWVSFVILLMIWIL